MALGMEAGLDPSNIVLDGAPAPPLPKRGDSPPIFGILMQTDVCIRILLGTEVALA